MYIYLFILNILSFLVISHVLCGVYVCVCVSECVCVYIYIYIYIYNVHGRGSGVLEVGQLTDNLLHRSYFPKMGCRVIRLCVFAHFYA